MAIKLVDELKAMGNFPIAHAEGINLVKTDGTEDNLQNLFDNKELGGGGDSSVTLTQQEYEALSEEQKLDGLYYAYDTKRIYKNGVQYGASDAEDIGYNNAESGIQATTVQGAIDKVVKTVEDTYAKTTDIPTTLPANGGNADTVNNHTVKSDVPENAVFTDTIYDGIIAELNANLNREIDRATEADEILKSRVDNITSLSEGSTTGDAELQDIRVKVDGTTATSAGNAVREQISELKGDLDASNKLNYDMYEYTENRYFADNLEKDKYISIRGEILDYPGWDLSDYLPVEKNEIYVWTFDLPTSNRVHNIYYGLFDVNRNWIGGGTTESVIVEDRNLIKTDDNTAYVRISQGSEYFTNKAMIIRKTLYDAGITNYIQFKRYLKKSPTKEIEEKTNSLETNYNPVYDNVVRSIQRIGEGMEHPIHSIEAFKDAYRKGFRILLCDLIFTSDNIPVCNHDSYLNQHYKNVYDSSGNLVSTDNPIYFSQNTYETLSQYSYGAVGYPLLKFADMLKLVRQLGVELYVEIKGMTEPQAKIACSLVEQYGLADKTSWSGTTQQMKWIIANIDTARVSTMPAEITDSVIENLNSLKTGKNKVFIFGWDTTVLSDEIVNKLIQNNIAFEQGTLYTNEDIVNYFKRGDIYYYCTGIETNSVVAGKALIENSLSN